MTERAAKKKSTRRPAAKAVERRKGDDRRAGSGTDRRDFPRPEGRRKNGGRRSDDPKDA